MDFSFFLIPLIFNLPFTSKLPLDYFFPGKPNDILVFLEILFRIILVISSLILIIQRDENLNFNSGLFVYIIGVILYFISWILLIVIDISIIENFNPVLRTILLFSPTYTPLIWLIGMGKICIHHGILFHLYYSHFAILFDLSLYLISKFQYFFFFFEYCIFTRIFVN